MSFGTFGDITVLRGRTRESAHARSYTATYRVSLLSFEERLFQVVRIGSDDGFRLLACQTMLVVAGGRFLEQRARILFRVSPGRLREIRKSPHARVPRPRSMKIFRSGTVTPQEAELRPWDASKLAREAAIPWPGTMRLNPWCPPIRAAARRNRLRLYI
jgi:hypothetical protein